MTEAPQWLDLLIAVAIGAVLLELAAALLAAPRGRRRVFAANALSGLFLLLALRAALADATLWVAVWLAGSLFAHGADLVLRLRERDLTPRPPPGSAATPRD